MPLWWLFCVYTTLDIHHQIMNQEILADPKCICYVSRQIISNHDVVCRTQNHHFFYFFVISCHSGQFQPKFFRVQRLNTPQHLLMIATLYLSVPFHGSSEYKNFTSHESKQWTDEYKLLDYLDIKRIFKETHGIFVSMSHCLFMSSIKIRIMVGFIIQLLVFPSE